MKPIEDFVKHFGANLNLDEKYLVRKADRYFLLNEKLRKLARDDFFYAGIYLGKVKGNFFFPSYSLLAMIAERVEANKVVVDDKSEWLFICGRDVFFRGIRKAIGAKNKGELTLVLNIYGECLGFGKIMLNLDEEQGRQKVTVKNISDIGDFLRRERH